MKRITLLLTVLISVLSIGQVMAHVDPDYKKTRVAKGGKYRLQAREACSASNAQYDQAINNVRARLTTGGDVWWDWTTGEGKYIVPNVDPRSGQPAVSSIFAGSVWLGGYDDFGNLKIAAQTYRNARQQDFWPGPLDDETGTTSADTCSKWDRFFHVLGDNIRSFKSKFSEAERTGVPLTVDDVPLDVLGWPGNDNPYFFEIHQFQLPSTTQGLAGFYDRNNDNVYDPLDGDFPVIEIRGCPIGPDNSPPDEMSFWIYNDNGNIHSMTGGLPIQMEVQVQVFAFQSDDELNDMTFHRYKLINRARQSIDSTFFAMWIDPDLGCYTDDYIGCDTARSLMYIYNQDAIDGETGCDCPQGVPTYCDKVPILGVDYFRGPLDEFGEEIGMSSFAYFNNPGIGNPNANTTDPDRNLPQQWYNYMSGSWKDGTRFTQGGIGYNPGSTDFIDYAFPDPPSESLPSWSMCSEGLQPGDRRTVQASGPFRLDPGAVNELIIGAVWVPDQDYPCPNLNALLGADNIAQGLFDNCFKVLDGPDPPELDFIELDKQIVVLLSNPESSNNFNERYNEEGIGFPDFLEDDERLYRFEGYKVYQLRREDVSLQSLNDPTQAILVFQSDIRNEVDDIYNWHAVENPDPSQPNVWIPTLRVEGSNSGIRHSFTITEDRFATGDRKLINHKKYYYVAVAYGYNNFAQFEVGNPESTQREPYIQSKRKITKYTVIPRPIVYEELNSSYGSGVIITRLDGQGVGGNFLKVAKEMREAIAFDIHGGEITYLEKAGPIHVRIFNPLEVKDGTYILRFMDENMSDNILNDSVFWELTADNGTVILADTTINKLNEQLIKEFGISVSIEQTESDPAKYQDDPLFNNGYIGVSKAYLDTLGPEWLLQTGVPEGLQISPFEPLNNVFNYVRTAFGEDDFEDDRRGSYNPVVEAGWVPYYLASHADDQYLVSPAWQSNTNSVAKNLIGGVHTLNNVDVVFTSNKDLWSRCIVVETSWKGASDFNLTQGISTEFDLRDHPSVGKDADPNTGLPFADGDGIGMGWFPGYAVDVETGERLNIFFGEASAYDESFAEFYDDSVTITRDMMWNPNGQLLLRDPQTFNFIPYTFFSGGLHTVYVTNSPYDECARLRNQLRIGANPINKARALRDITWAHMPLLSGEAPLLSYEEGLIPNELTVSLRVHSHYETLVGADYDNTGQGYNIYRIDIVGKESNVKSTKPEIETVLDNVRVVPNPYYGFSNYETSQFTTTVKVTNLPDRSTVTIYSLDGKFINQFTRNEVPRTNNFRDFAPTRSSQTIPDLEWSLENSKGIPVASGIYLFHIVDQDTGAEKILKWFGVNRQFDPSGL
jgi:hypothetical protein